MKVLLGIIVFLLIAFGMFMLVKFLLVIARRIDDKDKEDFEKRKY